VQTDSGSDSEIPSMPIVDAKTDWPENSAINCLAEAIASENVFKSLFISNNIKYFNISIIVIIL
jgi:hypothetical protein